MRACPANSNHVERQLNQSWKNVEDAEVAEAAKTVGAKEATEDAKATEAAEAVDKKEATEDVRRPTRPARALDVHHAGLPGRGARDLRDNARGEAASGAARWPRPGRVSAARTRDTIGLQVSCSCTESTCTCACRVHAMTRALPAASGSSTRCGP